MDPLGVAAGGPVALGLHHTLRGEEGGKGAFIHSSSMITITASEVLLSFVILFIFSTAEGEKEAAGGVVSAHRRGTKGPRPNRAILLYVTACASGPPRDVTLTYLSCALSF